MEKKVNFILNNSLRDSYRYAAKIGKVLFKILFLMRIENLKNFPEGGVVVIAEHKSCLDIPVLAFALPKFPRFTPAEKFFYHPLYSPILKRIGAIPVQGKSSISGLRRIIRVLKKGEIVVIFPQGGINKKTFYRGAFFSAVKAKVSVIVATIEGVEKILPPSKKRIGWSKIKVEFSEPFYPLSYKDASIEKKIFNKKINELKINGTEYSYSGF